MKVRSILPFLLVFSLSGRAQSNAAHIGTEYRYISRRERNTIIIYSDSTYTGKWRVGINMNLIDSGTWKRKGDLLILNSEESYTLWRPCDPRKKRLRKKTRPLYFRNSCFAYSPEALTWETREKETWIYKRVAAGK